MRKSRILLTHREFSEEFARCCEDYSDVHLAIAWFGDPEHTPPFELLEQVPGKLTATVGISFNHTHPNAIDWLYKNATSVRVVRDEGPLFHPKVYLFTGDDRRYAVFLGSSNFTYGGFYKNIEANVLLEGQSEKGKGGDIRTLQTQLRDWHSDQYSFSPTPEWIEEYRAKYERTVRRQKEQDLPSPPVTEEQIPEGSWVGDVGWKVYYQRVTDGLEGNDRTAQGYHDVLDAADEYLPSPWAETIFDDLDRRKIIGGMYPYGWLGHVGASGGFRGLMANGKREKLQTIARIINKIGVMNHPVPWDQLQSHLETLVKLGPTMKVWGRLLCLVRPDLFCTVSSDSLREKLSAALQVPKSNFHSVRGYIQLLRLAHSSPWFLSREPKKEEQAAVWKRRMAFMDAVFY